MNALTLVPLKAFSAGGFWFVDCYEGAARALYGAIRDRQCALQIGLGRFVGLWPDVGFKYRNVAIAGDALEWAVTEEGRN